MVVQYDGQNFRTQVEYAPAFYYNIGLLKMTTTGSKKTTAKKVSKKKVAKKQAVTKKVSTQKVATKKVATKVTAKKAAPKKAAPKKPAVKAAAKKVSSAKKKPSVISNEEKRMMVAMQAYYKWENAGFPGGQDWQHWLEAEKEVEEMFK
jgi:hypothetical protein